MHHCSDSPAWKHFNVMHPSFATKICNVILGLCTDGFQPFGQSGSKYSSWPVILTPYNLPPEMCMKEQYMFLTVIVLGPRNPKDKLDVYLQPLISELQALWEIGVETYDISRKKNFMLRAALLWIISDFPAYSMLFSGSTSGRLACDTPIPGVPLTTRQPAEYSWMSGYLTPLTKIRQSLFCTGSSTQGTTSPNNQL